MNRQQSSSSSRQECLLHHMSDGRGSSFGGADIFVCPEGDTYAGGFLESCKVRTADHFLDNTGNGPQCGPYKNQLIHLSLRTLVIVFLGIAAFVCTGCYEPGYRNDVTTNAQGQVEVHRVPKDPQPAEPTPPVPTQAVAPSTVVPTGQSLDQQIADLEAQVRALNVRIDQLKLQKRTAQ